MRYLKGTAEMGLIFGSESAEWWPGNPPSYRLVSYSDINFARDPGDQKSVIGYYLFINGAVISWSSKK